MQSLLTFTTLVYNTSFLYLVVELFVFIVRTLFTSPVLFSLSLGISPNFVNFVDVTETADLVNR